MTIESSSLDKAPKIPYLSEDLVMSILLKLPVKSLGRFKCVCKSWYSLINCPTFITMHLNSKDRHNDYLAFIGYKGISSEKLSISFFSYHTKDIPPNLPNFQFDHNPNFIGFCNGLLRVVSNEINFYVVNPTTKESKEPNKPLGSPSYGFGFDPKANDYKLVRITIEKNELLTLKSNCWRSILMNDHSTSVMKRIRNLDDLWSNAVMKNSFHWIGRSKEPKKEKFIVVAFDLFDEEFRDIKIPGDYQDFYDFPWHCHRCSVLQDCLSVSSVVHRSVSGYKIEVWVMREYGIDGSWTKQYCFSMSTVLYLSTLINLIEFHKQGHDHYWPLQKSDEELIFSSSSSKKEFFFKNIKMHPRFGAAFFDYRETLVPILIDQKDNDQIPF
ncbi:F-box domain containing protein [Trema orientale]|uniref:F-box domain containing protein n=1 Tax=Trema orientale TaxID=63057 RepID=A0A2P5EHD8_TREOI|nr:F-box domain containing protein [Trema orientale]